MKRYEIMLELCMECLILAAQIFLFVFLIPKTLGFLWPFVIGWLIALIVLPLTHLFQQKLNMNKRFGSILILVSLILIVAGVFFALITVLGREALNFMADLPVLYEEFVDSMGHIPETLKSFPLLPAMVEEHVDQIFAHMKNGIFNVVGNIGRIGMNHAGSIAVNVTNFCIGIIVSILSAYFFIIYKEKMSTGYFGVLPQNLKQRIDQIWFHIKNAVGGYILAQFKLMGIIFLILSIGLFLSGNPYAMFVALLIAFVDIIPFLGTGFVLIPWAIFDFIAGNYGLMILRLVLYVTCLLGRQLLQPKIIGDSVGLDPFVTLVLIYVGFKVDGIRGFLMAMIIGIILLNFYKLGLFDSKIKRWKGLIRLLNNANRDL